MLRKSAVQTVKGLLDIIWLSDSDRSRRSAYASLLAYRFTPSIPRVMAEEIEVIGEAYPELVNA
jgi:hypothetical protein